MYATWSTDTGATITDYDIQNISINGNYLTTTQGTSDAPSVIITNWTELAVGTNPTPTTITIATPTTYGDYGTITGETTSSGYVLPDGSLYSGDWSAQTEHSGLKINIVIQAYQGDYPTTKMTQPENKKSAYAKLSGNKVVEVEEIVEETESSTASVKDVVVNFSNVSTYTTSESQTGDVDSKIIEMKVTSITDTKTAVSLVLKEDETEIPSPEFDKPVVITMTVPGKLTEPKITYNGTADGEILSSTINESANTTTIVFSVKHFSEYVIADTIVTTADGLQASLNAGGYVKLGDNLSVSNGITVSKSAMLDLNGKEISTSMGYLIDVQADLTISNGTLNCTSTGGAGTTVLKVVNQTNAVNLTLNNVDVVGPTNDAANAAIYVESNAGEIVIDINGGEITANHYPLNIRSGNSNLKITADDATIQGYCAMQCHSTNVTFEFTDCNLIGLNQWNNPGDNEFAVIVLYNDATGSRVTCRGCTVSAVENGTAKESFFDFRSVSTVVLNDCTYKYKGTTVTVDEIKGGTYTYISESDLGSVTYSVDGNVLTITGVAKS